MSLSMDVRIDDSELTRHQSQVSGRAPAVIRQLINDLLARGHDIMKLVAPTGQGGLDEQGKPYTGGQYKQTIEVKRIDGYSGVVGPTVPYAAAVEYGTKPHVIRPKRAKQLSFKSEGATGWWLHFKKVNHPGTKGQYVVRTSADMMGKEAPPMVQMAIASLVGGGS